MSDNEQIPAEAVESSVPSQHAKRAALDAYEKTLRAEARSESLVNPRRR